VALTTLPAPCWHLVRADGAPQGLDGDGISHYQSCEGQAARAAASLATDYAEPVTIVQFDQPCVVLACDGCGFKANDGVWACTHFRNYSEARSLADETGVTVTVDGAVWCNNCQCLPHAHVGERRSHCERCSWPADEHEHTEEGEPVNTKYPQWPDLTDEEGDALSAYFESTCASCVEGSCHWDGDRAQSASAAAAAGLEYIDPESGGCCCNKHLASVEARRAGHESEAAAAAAVALHRSAAAAATLEDGHVVFAHTCGGSRVSAILNSADWKIVQRDPITVKPSVSCRDCGLHGWITNGQLWTTGGTR
jgi:hypothetical protein